MQLLAWTHCSSLIAKPMHIRQDWIYPCQNMLILHNHVSPAAASPAIGVFQVVAKAYQGSSLVPHRDPTPGEDSRSPVLPLQNHPLPSRCQRLHEVVQKEGLPYPCTRGTEVRLFMEDMDHLPQKTEQFAEQILTGTHSPELFSASYPKAETLNSN